MRPNLGTRHRRLSPGRLCRSGWLAGWLAAHPLKVTHRTARAPRVLRPGTPLHQETHHASASPPHASRSLPPPHATLHRSNCTHVNHPVRPLGNGNGNGDGRLAGPGHGTSLRKESARASCFRVQWPAYTYYHLYPHTCRPREIGVGRDPRKRKAPVVIAAMVVAQLSGRWRVRPPLLPLSPANLGGSITTLPISARRIRECVPGCMHALKKPPPSTLLLLLLLLLVAAHTPPSPAAATLACISETSRSSSTRPPPIPFLRPVGALPPTHPESRAAKAFNVPLRRGDGQGRHDVT
ncbi:hypothetical protein PCL_07568 [Purpureocillium lilacinum]|uniref:Uncharacterized protein n=1 Tax=Purpureocillium lilacinum TaxID=33203 RepID=A0A2U3EIB3_PURLI|nr:hypothetical protein PCL_07568 [Purpureocillium lilacinum]